MIWDLSWDPTICARLCLTLLHSVWQTSLITLAVWIVDALWRGLSLERRYALHVTVWMVTA